MVTAAVMALEWCASPGQWSGAPLAWRAGSPLLSGGSGGCSPDPPLHHFLLLKRLSPVIWEPKPTVTYMLERLSSEGPVACCRWEQQVFGICGEQAMSCLRVSILDGFSVDWVRRRNDAGHSDSKKVYARLSLPSSRLST